MNKDGQRRPELLAPVGSWEALVAAVQSGADAVYLGGKDFSARQSAANFAPDELARAVTYAHERAVKVYVTVNTLIKESELEDVLRYLADLYAEGVDAVILQDLGLLQLTRRIFPSLPVHASTQMTIHHPDGVRWLKDQGVSRVVLARELTLPEIRACAEIGLEVEVFVHGALCVCYSGQCLVSSMIGGRSGNRGRCAQPCRLEYSLVGEGGRPLPGAGEEGPHLLSTRELATLDRLPELAEAGVASLKIEGRMKRPEYVATVVRVYREALAEPAGAGDGKATEERWRQLAQAFNRGFTPGYLLGNPGRELMSYQRPSNRGVFLGRVNWYDPRRGLLTLRLEAEVRAGDGVEVWVSKGGRVGGTLSRFWSADRRDGATQPLDHAEPGQKIVIPLGGQIRVGDRVFKTSDAALESRAAATFSSARETLKIPLRATLSVRLGEPARLLLVAPDGLRAEARGKVPAARAERRALDEESARGQLDRLGNTPFALAQLDLEVEPGTIVPFSELNALRRTAVEYLEAARAEKHRPPAVDLAAARRSLAETLSERAARGRVGFPPNHERPPLLAVEVAGVESLSELLAAQPDRLILGGERFRPVERPFYTPAQVAEVGRLCREKGVEFVLGFPRIIRRTEMAALVELAHRATSALPSERPTALLVGNLGLLQRLSSEGVLTGPDRPSLHADWPLNVFNSAAVALLAELGAAQVALSPELSLAEVAELAALSPRPVEVLVQGPLELMVTEYCAPGALLGGRTAGQACARPCLEQTVGLRDRLGLVFPVRLDASCRLHLANPKELCLVDELGAVSAAGPAALRLDCRFREASYATAVTWAYRKALTLLQEAGEPEERDPELRERFAVLRRELEALSPQGITKGHYFRGVE